MADYKGENSKIYPAVFEKAEEGGFLVDFPDFGGTCFTEGDDLGEAFEMASDVLAGTILNMLADGEPLPKASDIEAFNAEKNGFVNYIEVDIVKYKNVELTKSVRKNISLPVWLDQIATLNNISYSGILQSALLETLGLEFLKSSKINMIEEVIELLKERDKAAV